MASRARRSEYTQDTGFVNVMSGSSASGKVWKRMLALFLGLASAIAVAEIGVRSYVLRVQRANSLEHLEEYREKGLEEGRVNSLACLIRFRDDDVLMYEMLPDLDVLWGPNHVVTNNVGIMGDVEYALERGSETLRIAGIGDSGMAGLGVDYEDSYMAVLDKNLNGQDTDDTYDVLNFAVPGYNTRIEGGGPHSASRPLLTRCCGHRLVRERHPAAELRDRHPALAP